MKLAAITGSIGCGKTTLAGLARELGFVVFDADKWSRRLYFQQDYIHKIAEVFPDVMDNGMVDKKKLRELVFNDNEKLKQLEAVSHPFLKQKLKEVINKNRFSDDIFFLDAALLFEAGWDKYCDFIIVADVADDIQKQRVMKRDNVSAEHFEKINSVQMNKKAKADLADAVIDTDVPLNLLKVDILNIIEGLENNG